MENTSQAEAPTRDSGPAEMSDEGDDSAAGFTLYRSHFSPEPQHTHERAASLSASLDGPARALDGSCGLRGFTDSEGRVDESRLRTLIFKQGGVDPSVRTFVWKFLFGMYPCSSTALQRTILEEELRIRYQLMKKKWQSLLPTARRIRINGTDDELIAALKYYEEKSSKTLCNSTNDDEDMKERTAFLELQAQVLIDKTHFIVENLQEAIRIIDKDVPRTERDLPYFVGEGSANLLVLRDILITFAAFHPDVSYAQGMNDLCSRFLEVLDSEVDAYWCFASYMEKFSSDFKADGMCRKIELEAQLLKELDPLLYAHLVRDELDSLAFCHRWLLLGFQREFSHSDALCLFEVLSTNHLELNSLEGELARDRERLYHIEREAGEVRPELPSINLGFTFDLFVCAAILLENRERLLSCQSETELIQFTNSLKGKLDLKKTLHKAEEHFFNYCRKSVLDYFNQLSLESPSREPFGFQLWSLFS
ncbi:TBC1 domain family member 15 [Erpetoichthys calabaricus]|uniref:Si:dkey-238d18.4 n=1 Tax=Erpetoichthys calabaricus TaxID=27687 RepID=A0A8C4T182_ERPCA|nr:TBC1 domain family member 15 [Erpetoichthys calabaricus]